MPTEHYTGRQTSYVTLAGAGDHADQPDGAAFALPTTSRYYLDELDVMAPASVGGVVAIGDSITDGFQARQAELSETQQGLNANARWPDFLERRILAAGLPFSVPDAGISGNRIVQDAAAGSGPPQFGPSALSRLQADAIDLPGVTTAIVLEGINDVGGGSPIATPDHVIAGLAEMVDRLRVAGLRVLLGTLTPTGGALLGHGTPAEVAARAIVNSWIRSQHVANGVIDFDAAVRDPSDPGRINPLYDGGDDVHFNPAGYAAMADTVPLAELARPVCARPRRPQGHHPQHAARPVRGHRR
jgi:lysophospholipase L1-like esterase